MFLQVLDQSTHTRISLIIGIYLVGHYMRIVQLCIIRVIGLPYST